MFMGPLEQVKPWQTSGCEGIHRFLSRVWRLFVNEETGETRALGTTSPEVKRALHVAIKEASEGIEALKFNTPVSKMMELVNACKGEPPARAEAEAFVLILSPYAPHLGEELWQRLGHEESLTRAPWPAWDPAALLEDTVEYAVQVGGKMRATVRMPRESAQAAVVAAAIEQTAVARQLEGKAVVKEIFIPGRLLNLIVK
jgi:leucyl-tRNA synthetase